MGEQIVFIFFFRAISFSFVVGKQFFPLPPTSFLFETSGRIFFFNLFLHFKWVNICFSNDDWYGMGGQLKFLPWSCLQNHILGPNFLGNIWFSQHCRHYKRTCPLFLTWFHLILIKFIGFDWMGTMDSLLHLMGTNALHPHFLIVYADMNFDWKASYYKILPLNEIFSMPYHKFLSKVVWLLFPRF